jgi:cobalt-precorrin-5B (C1)-methyltransferase
MIRAAIAEIAAANGDPGDVEVEIAIPGGEALAAKTMNGRLGIIGGLSILGTTGIVIPYSCSSWIQAIRSGIDVARGAGLTHVAGSTGAESERAVQRMYGLPEIALIDMGDFVGGMLKYLRSHPVAKVSVAGGVAKMSKLAQGMLDVHSKRGAPDLDVLADTAIAAGASEPLASRIRSANMVAEAFQLAAGEGVALGDYIAERAWQTAAKALDHPEIALDIAVFDREGVLMGRTDFKPSHQPSRPLKRR